MRKLQHEETAVQSLRSQCPQWPKLESQELLWQWPTLLWERWVWWRYLHTVTTRLDQTSSTPVSELRKTMFQILVVKNPLELIVTWIHTHRIPWLMTYVSCCANDNIWNMKCVYVHAVKLCTRHSSIRGAFLCSNLRPRGTISLQSH